MPSLPTSAQNAIHYTPAVRRQQNAETQRERGRSSASSSLVESIRQTIQSSKAFDSRVRLCELNLDTVLSSTSYRSLMRQTFGGDGAIMPGAIPPGAIPPGCASLASGVPRIPTVARSFEESYMRQPAQGERECARGARCECMFIDPKQPFVSVEFLTMEELSDLPEERQLCVLCSRKETQFLYYDMVFGGRVYNSVIQVRFWGVLF